MDDFRFFDKCFSLIIAGNGNTCVNFEHSWGDGVAVLRYMNEVYKDTIEQPKVHPDTTPANIDPSDRVNELGKPQHNPTFTPFHPANIEPLSMVTKLGHPGQHWAFIHGN